MIKKNLLLIVFLMTSISSYSQNKRAVSLYTGISNADFLSNDALVGTASTTLKNFSELGLMYTKSLNTKFAIGTAIHYTNATLSITPAFTGGAIVKKEEDFEMISIPLFAQYTMWNYFFVHSGLLLDMQTSENSTVAQDGIGYSIGLGGKIDFGNVSLFINPNFKQRALIPFEETKYHQKLTGFGLQVGVGYTF